MVLLQLFTLWGGCLLKVRIAFNVVVYGLRLEGIERRIFKKVLP